MGLRVLGDEDIFAHQSWREYPLGYLLVRICSSYTYGFVSRGNTRQQSNLTSPSTHIPSAAFPVEAPLIDSAFQ